MTSTRIASMGFSWADEVEREEQEELERAKRKHEREEAEEEEEEEKQQTKRRADPFGAARPRELVLEEKGVDWRKIDREIDACSNRRSVANSRKKDHPRKKSHKQQNIEEIAPPLRCPPKNTANLTERIHMVQPDRWNAPSNNARFGQDLPVNYAHSSKRVSQRNVRMVESGHVAMNPNIGTLNSRHGMGSSCKRKYVAATCTDEMENNQAVNSRMSYRDDGSYYSDHARDMNSRGNYTPIVAGEEVRATRAILGDLNTERTNPRKNKRPGDGAAAKRNSDFQGLMCRSTEPTMLLRQNYRRRRIEPSIRGNPTTGNMLSVKDNDSRSKVLSSQTKSSSHR